MNMLTSDRRIDSVIAMPSPAELAAELPLSDANAQHIADTRERIADIIHDRDPRLLVVVGPCSIHDTAAAMDYASRLAELRERHRQTLEIVMRVYFEKPRTIVGWKGLINDPRMDESFRIDEGLHRARKLLIELAALKMPAACEFLDAATGQYYADTVSWGAIGARTTESQVHRELASGLSCPVGFKNATSGDVGIAIDAIQAAAHSHAFLSPTREGRLALHRTRGNEDAHLILRGGASPNYHTEAVQAAFAEQQRRGVSARIMIDCSHGNSQKDHRRQITVANAIAERLPREKAMIAGVMIESHLVEGRQNSTRPADDLVYGQSITDACIGWSDTETLLNTLAGSMQAIMTAR